jgi:hypothetical protein
LADAIQTAFYEGKGNLNSKQIWQKIFLFQ